MARGLQLSEGDPEASRGDPPPDLGEGEAPPLCPPGSSAVKPGMTSVSSPPRPSHPFGVGVLLTGLPAAPRAGLHIPLGVSWRLSAPRPALPDAPRAEGSLLSGRRPPAFPGRPRGLPGGGSGRGGSETAGPQPGGARPGKALSLARLRSRAIRSPRRGRSLLTHRPRRSSTRARGLPRSADARPGLSLARGKPAGRPAAERTELTSGAARTGQGERPHEGTAGRDASAGHGDVTRGARAAHLGSARLRSGPSRRQLRFLAAGPRSLPIGRSRDPPASHWPPLKTPLFFPLWPRLLASASPLSLTHTFKPGAFEPIVPPTFRNYVFSLAACLAGRKLLVVSLSASPHTQLSSRSYWPHLVASIESFPRGWFVPPRAEGRQRKAPRSLSRPLIGASGRGRSLEGSCTWRTAGRLPALVSAAVRRAARTARRGRRPPALLAVSEAPLSRGTEVAALSPSWLVLKSCAGFLSLLIV